MIAQALTDDVVVDLIATKAGVQRPFLRRSLAMRELDLSLEEYFAVVAEIEDRYDIEIDDLVAVDCATLGGLIDRLRDQVAHPMRPTRYHA